MIWPHAKSTRTIFGPPGTGKTTALVRLYGELLSRGLSPADIATVSHTRASASELKLRIAKEYGLRTDDMPHSRTLHSAALQSLPVDAKRVFDEKSLRAWAREYGYRITVGVEPGDPQTDDDRLLAIALKARHLRVPIEGLAGLSDYDLRHACRLARRLEAWLDQFRLIDFTAMLERAIAEDVRVPVAAVLVDEVQDLSPLAIAAAASMFAGAGEFFLAGDDDQSLYGFSGASPRWLVGLARSADRTDVLAQSFRVPARIHSLATAVIAEVRERVPKRYAATGDEGVVEFVAGPTAALASIDETTHTMLLARTWATLRRYASRLRCLGIPFVVPARPPMSPWRAAEVDAVKTAISIRDGDPVSAVDLRNLLEHVRSGRASPLPHGTKAKLSTYRGTFAAADIEAWGLGYFRDQIRSYGPAAVLTRLSVDTRTFLQRLVRRGALRMPLLELRSIHDAKGLEADHVVLMSDWGHRAFAALHDPALADDERRAAYVAVTRARRQLTIVESRRRSYPWPPIARIRR